MSVTTKSYCHIYGQLGQTGARFSAELDHLLNLGLDWTPAESDEAQRDWA